ncbi:MAG: DNA polymerase I, partial [Clostridia bacterium]|nr:DNA polymerase I [Clostridia bacterium]
MANKADKLVIIDGNSMLYRLFYAMPLLTNSKGDYTNAIYGYANEIVKIATEIKPTHMLVAFDAGKITFRNNIFDGYKANRSPMPAELVSQVEPIKEMLSLMNIKVIEQKGIEADDIIGTIAKRFNKTQTIIITGDRDSFQLIDETTSVYFTKRGISDLKIYNNDNLKQEYGVGSWQVVDLKALQGDSSDNIPGVRGIGPKTATELINNYGSLDGVYKNIENIKGSTKQKLIENKEMAYLSQTLARIKTDAEIPCTLEDLKFEFPFSNELKDFFEKYSLRMLLKKEEIFKKSEANINADIKNESLINIKEIKTIEELKNITDKKSLEWALYRDDSNTWHASSGETEYAFTVKVDLLTDGLDEGEIVYAFKNIIEDDNITKIFYDTKAMLYILKFYDIKFPKNIFDVSVAINLSQGTLVKDMNDVYSFTGKNSTISALTLMDAKHELEKIIMKENLQNSYYNIEIPLIFTLFNMEMRGFKVDVSKLNELEKVYAKKVEDLTNQIYKVCGHEFNIKSPKQLAVVLFDELKLPKNKKESTSVEVLEELEGMHEVVSLILEYRKVTKIYSTYIVSLKDYIDKNGFIHTSFNQTQTATGRLSSSDPNLQNLPIRDEEGKIIRSMFTASSKENVLIDADYSQIELRVLAHLSDDDFYIASFNNNEDIHTKTASEVFGVDKDSVTPAQRRVAKVVNFGVIYGMSRFGLSSDLKITQRQAKEYI